MAVIPIKSLNVDDLIYHIVYVLHRIHSDVTNIALKTILSLLNKNGKRLRKSSITRVKTRQMLLDYNITIRIKIPRAGLPG